MQQQLRFVIGAEHPPEDAIRFYPYTSGKGIGRRKSQLTHLGAKPEALDLLTAKRDPFLKFLISPGSTAYILPTEWEHTRPQSPFADEENWASNLSAAFDDAGATQALPLSVWVEVPEGVVNADAIGRLLDAAARYDHLASIATFALSYPGGFDPEMQSEIEGHLAKAFPEAEIAYESRIDTSEAPRTKAAGGPKVKRRAKPSRPAGPKPPQIAETAPYYPDDPARIDQLNRKSVAEALANIIDGVWKGADQREDDKSFIAHLHGPWGSGKSSILHFLEEILETQRHPAPPSPNSDCEGEGGPWIVVHYNAWQMQEMGPPWWTVMDTAFRQISDALTDPAARWRHKAQNRWWRFRNGWMPSVIPAAVLLGALVWLLLAAEDSTLIDLSKGAAGLAALVSAIFLLKGDMGLFNVRKAKQYRELAEDPLGPLTARFEAMVAEVGRPVAIFIDDLDRCNADYVVDLLTQIQTLFRRASVLYVVAGDRDWICSSYEQTYEDFSDKIAAPGHSLGHMFLEKIFQISVEVPEITEDQREAFLGHLLNGDKGADPDDLAAVEKAAEADMANVTTEAEVIAKNDAFSGSAAEKAVYSAKALEVLHRPDLARERQKHILLNYADHIEPNPRAMKRLLNAYGFRRGFDIQAAERSDQDALIRWTIIENRWPVMANYLSGKTVTDRERMALVGLKDDPRLRAVFDDVDWDKLAILKDVQDRFDDLTPPQQDD